MIERFYDSFGRDAGYALNGFRNIDTMISLVLLFCSSIEIPWPGRKRNEPNKHRGQMKLCGTDCPIVIPEASKE
ncbi:MAG: hypothetical protein ACI4QT_09195 [Kiritimatiellia bacterium]